MVSHPSALKDAVHWLLIAASIADALLLVRITSLKLHRIYLFITLDAALGVLFDAAGLWLGWESPEYLRVYVYSRFLFALLLPAIAWDVFGEVKQVIKKALQVGAAKMVLALAVTGVFAGFMTMSIDTGEAGTAGLVDVLARLIWGSACLASLIFLITTNRALVAQNAPVSINTRVWYIFYLLIIGSSIFDCVLYFSGIRLGEVQADSLNVAFILYGLACTAWCILHLRPFAGELTPAT